jgi:hypothetical protein
LTVTSLKEFPFGWKKSRKNPILKHGKEKWELLDVVGACIKPIGDRENKWYGHYSARGKDRKYHLGACFAKNPEGPFICDSKPILGQGNWDFNGPARPDFIEVNNEIWGAYESAKTGPVFQVGGYRGSKNENTFLKIYSDKPFFSGLDLGLQFANPCLFAENGKIYLLAGRKAASDHTPCWRFVDLFVLNQ